MSSTPRLRAVQPSSDAPDATLATLDALCVSITNARQEIAELAHRPVAPTATSDTLGVTISAFTGLGYALSARALLLLALLGTFVLALRATDTLGIVILATWGALTVLPTTVLEIRKGRHTV